MGAHEHRQDTLIDRLRREAEVRDDELSEMRLRLAEAEHELEDLRAIRDALTPSELPERLGLELAAAFVPATEVERAGPSPDFVTAACMTYAGHPPALRMSDLTAASSSRPARASHSGSTHNPTTPRGHSSPWDPPACCSGRRA